MTPGETQQPTLAATLRYIADCKAITLDEGHITRLRAAAALLEAANQRQWETERLRVLLAWAMAYVPEPLPSHEGGLFARRYQDAAVLTQGMEP